MFPDLSYILNYLFGTPVDNAFAIMKTFGLFLALALASAGYLVSLELKRKEKQGLIPAVEEDNPALKGAGLKELLINILIGFFLGFKIPYIIDHFDQFKRDPASIIFSGKGDFLYGLIAAIVIGGLLYFSYKKEKEKDTSQLAKKVLVHPHQRVFEIVTLAAVFGIIGSRLFSILENFSDFMKDPIGQLFSGSGLTVYGGLILAFTVIFFYVKKKGIKPIHMMDAAAPALMIGYAVGRIGCQMSGDGDWGIVNTLEKPSWFIFPDWTWSYSFPHNVLNEGVKIPGCVGEYCHQLDPGVFPTSLYEIIYSFIALGILWALRTRFKTPGIMFFIYLAFTGIGRFLIEFIRVNPRYNYFGYDLSQAQYIAIGFMVISIVGLVYLFRKSKQQV